MFYQGNLDRYELEEELASGGEGAVWTVRDNKNVVAKVYHTDKINSDPKLERKIVYMVNNPPADSVLNQIAWPKDVIRDDYGRFIGFIMPKLDTDSDLKRIYPYKKIQITTEQRIIIAINICIVISEVHKAGYIFGDFNPMNIGVNLKTGHVAFFDADSYHFTDDSTGETYRCGVGADGYIAPELIQRCHDYGTDFLETPLPTFTKETDEFALAIHVFKLLMNGFTPFNGIKECESVSQANPGNGNIAIERDNYCFKPGNKPQSVAVPELNTLPKSIQDLLKKTFIGGNTNPGDRATAEEWRDALIELKSNLTQCKDNPLHFYYSSNQSCPFCAADERYRQMTEGFQSSYSTGSSGASNSQYTFTTPINVPQNNNVVINNSSNQPGGKSKFWTILSILNVLSWIFLFPIRLCIAIALNKNMGFIGRLLLCAFVLYLAGEFSELIVETRMEEKAQKNVKTETVVDRKSTNTNNTTTSKAANSGKTSKSEKTVKKEKKEELEYVSLSNCGMVTTNQLKHFTTITDNYGTVYEGGIGAMHSIGDIERNEYTLDGKYSVFRGKVVLDSERRLEPTEDICFIYGDNKLLFQSQPLYVGCEPDEFVIDITNIKVLKIMIDKPYSLRLVDCFLYVDDSVPTQTTAKKLNDSINEISLNDMFWYAAEDPFETYEDVIDNQGNIYDNAVGAGLFSFSDETAYECYRLNGEYSAIRGTVVLPFDYKDKSNYRASVKIIADDVPIYDSGVLEVGWEPQDFDLDLTGVNELRVEIFGNHEFVRIANCMLYK